MATEIERKFLLASDDWRREVTEHTDLVQGYLSRGKNSAIRVRIKGEQAHLNIKHTIDGIHRLEYEYPIPIGDAREMLERVALRPLIDKTRHHVRRGPHLWEIDEFHGDNAGLVVAEVELSAADEEFERPAWLGTEVSDDARYYNSNLSEHPYSRW
jgi:adenylate cyclase